jgi:cell division protein FtsQ
MITVDPTPAHPIAPEAPVRPSRAWTWLKRGVATLAFAALGAGSWWLWHDGTAARLRTEARQAAIAFGTEIGFTVKDMLVVGRHETTADALLEALRIGHGGPILAFDAKAAKARVEALPWVRSAAVERILPDRIVVRIQERQPMAIWQNRGEHRLIDGTGTAIPGATLDRFGHLLQVVGEDAPANTPELMRLLGSEPVLAGRVKAAVRVGERRWNLRLDNGVDVRLPEQDAQAAWSRLAEYERTHKVLERDVQVLDLRLPDRLIVRRPGDPPPVPGKARET